MAQKFNWGAALTTLGRGLGDYAEQQRRERTAALLREQALDDENRRREQELADRAELFRRQDLLAEQQYGRVMPPSFTLPGGDVTTGGFGGMRFKPATELALDMYPRQKAAPLPDPTAEVVINRNGQQQILAVEPTRIPQAVAALETTLEVPVLGGVDQNGRPVYNMTPVPRPQVGAGSGSGKPKDPKDIVAEWYGGEKQSGDFDPKTGIATPFSFPFRGSVFDPVTSPIDVIPDLTNAVRNEQAQGRSVATEQDARRLLEGVLGGYDVNLARQMDIDLGAQFHGWQPNTSGGKAIPGEYRKARGPWGFDNAPGPIRGATDWMVGDDIKSAAEFYADIVNKQLADGTDEVEMRTINAWLKKKGLTLDQLAQYLKTSRAQGVDLPAAGAAVVNQRAAAADTSISKY